MRAEGDATNKIINNSAPHRTNEHDSKEHEEVGTRGNDGITQGRSNDDTNASTTNEARLVGSEDPKDENQRNDTSCIKSHSEVNTKLNKNLNKKYNKKQISKSDTRLGITPRYSPRQAESYIPLYAPEPLSVDMPLGPTPRLSPRQASEGTISNPVTNDCAAFFHLNR